MHIFRKWTHPTQKPPFGAEIDWSDQITECLEKCWLFNEYAGAPVELIDKTVLGMHASWSGGNVSFDGAQYINTKWEPFFSLTDSMTFEVLFRTTTSTLGRFVGSIADVNSPDDPFIFVGVGDDAGTAGKFHFRIRSNDSETVYPTESITSVDNYKWYHGVGVRDTENDVIKVYVNGVKEGEKTDVSTNNFTFDGYPLYIGTANFRGIADGFIIGDIAYIRFWRSALSDSEIERLYYEPFSFFLAPFPWFMIDLAAGQYSWNGNIPVNLIPSSVKEVRFYPQTGGAPIVITPQAQAQAAYKAKGEQNIALTPQGDIRAQYVEDGSVLVRLALAAEKQVRFLAEGQVPLAIVPACEAQAAYTEDGQVPFVLFPEASARASYAHQGEVPLALQVSADIACAFNVAGGLGLILLPQGTWTYVPVTGGAVYTWAGNIPVSLVLEADIRAKFDVTGQTFLTLTQTAEIATKYRHIGDLLLRLIPAGQATASWLLEGEIQLRLVPQGVAVLVKPSEQEDWYFVGVIEEDDIRAVFDDALHAKIWP